LTGAWRRVRAWPHWPAVGFALGVKLLLFGLGFTSFVVLWNDRVGSAGAFLDIWNHWDSLNYLHIAEWGYQATGEMKHLLVYYPLYPALIRLLEPLAGSFLASAFWVSTIASLAAAALFHRLASLDEPQDADRALFFLFAFPTSFSLHIAYTESLFLALSFASLLCARTRRWGFAGLLGACAALTRINGAALGAALALEAWAAWREDRRFRREWLFLLLVPLGAIGYLLLNLQVTGDPLAFLRHQHDHFGRTLAPPWMGYLGLWMAFLVQTSRESFTMYSQELLFGTLMVLGCIFSWRRLRASYTAWMLVNTVLVMSFTFPWSVPRYALIQFPLMLLMARLGRRPLAFGLMAVWCVLFLGLFTSLFVRGFWAF
jgi:hypothetical protein